MVNHVFKPGHRIMVQVQSSLFPGMTAPQTFVTNISMPSRRITRRRPSECGIRQAAPASSVCRSCRAE